MTDSEFWKSTPYLTNLFLAQSADREKVAWRRAIWQAWHIGAFYRTKRLPRLQELLTQFETKAGKKQARRMSQEEMLHVIEQLNVVYGGKDKRKKAS